MMIMLIVIVIIIISSSSSSSSSSIGAVRILQLVRISWSYSPINTRSQWLILSVL